MSVQNIPATAPADIDSRVLIWALSMTDFVNS